MRYLRMLTNAALAGLAGAAYVAVLILQLNPEVPLYPDELAGLLTTLAAYYGVNLAVLFYALIVLRQLFSAEIMSPGWISLRVLSWSLAGASAWAAALMWLNLGGFGPMLDPETARRMAAGAAWLSGAAFLFLVIALVHYTVGRPATLAGALLFSLTAVASLAVPITARGPGSRGLLESRPLGLEAALATAGSQGRVTLILLDGASLDFIRNATIAGRLPGFGRVLDDGADMHLATLRPTQPAPVWSSVATGKLPFKTGVRSAATYRPRFSTEALELLPDFVFAQGLLQTALLIESPHTSMSVRTRTLWSILSGAGLSVGIAGWPLTHPVQPVRGFLVSDEFYKQDTLSVEPDDPAAVYPAELLNPARVAAAARDPVVPISGDSLRAAIAELPPEILSSQAFAIDRLYDRVSRALSGTPDVRVSATRYRLLDQAGHYFLRYAMPRAFGDVTEQERRRYGRVLESCYAVIDALVQHAVATLQPGDLLLVVSGYGMEPLGVEKRLLERVVGDPLVSGTHEHAPDGFLLAYGDAVARGRRPRGSLVDVTPTVLYFLGLPLGRDMDGFARTDVFNREFTDLHPVTYIPTYDR